MPTSMTYPAPTAAPVTDDRCPPHAWITVGNLTSCSRCGTIDWSAAIPRPTHTEETPMTELAAENAALWALVEAVRDALDLPVPATGGDAQQRTPVTYPSIAEEGAE